MKISEKRFAQRSHKPWKYKLKTLKNYRKRSNKRPLSNKRLLSNKRPPYAVKLVLNAPL